MSRLAGVLTLVALSGPALAAGGIEDRTPPLYRKIALNGAPLADAAPDLRERTDEEPEQTYVDALTLRLQHATTDIYIPLVDRHFALMVRRNVQGAAWREGDLAPRERPDLPFGNCWSSGLAANLQLIETENETRAIVTDEEGSIHDFVVAPGEEGSFLPLPSTRGEQDAAQLRLGRDAAAGGFVFRRKHGTRLFFEGEPTVKILRDGGRERRLYFRLRAVEDRFGTRVDYRFQPENGTLIPDEIAFKSRVVRIERNAGGRVERIIDPAGSDIFYDYREPVQLGGAPLLTAVRVPPVGGTRAVTRYEYEEIATDAAAGPVVWHCNVNRIEDPRGAAYTFTYRFSPEERGPLRVVATITLPGGEGETRFFAYERPVTGGGDFPERLSFVKDASGHGRVYEFLDYQEARIADGERVLARFGYPRAWQVTYYNGSRHEFRDGALSVPYETVKLGTERYEFDPGAGLALARAVDLSGRATEFRYDEGHPPAATHEVANPTAERLADPSARRDALGQVTSYVYDPDYRLRAGRTDAAGRIERTVFFGPAIISEQLYADREKLRRNEPFSRRDFEYKDPRFPGFRTRVIQRKTGSSPEALEWERDLMVDYAADELGQTVRETRDPTGTKGVIRREYDANGNLRAFFGGDQVEFKYDARNRLARVFRRGPEGELKIRRLEYDARGNTVREVDFDGASRTREFDLLSRVVREEEFPAGAAADAAPSGVTEFRYTPLGLKTRSLDEAGRVCFITYDGLLRPTRIAYEDNSFADYRYEENCGGALFESSAFRATNVTVPKVLDIALKFDPLDRAVERERTDYARDLVVERTRWTYDAVGNRVVERPMTGGAMRYEYDPMDRLIRTLYPDGRSERVLYSSTGLRYATIAADGTRHDEEIDLEDWSPAE